MKRLSAIICAAGLMFSLCACHKTANDTPKKQSPPKTVNAFQDLTGDEIIDAHIKDIHSITSKEYLKICSALETSSYDASLTHDASPVYDALTRLQSEGTLSDPAGVARKTLISSSALIRAEGIWVSAQYSEACTGDPDCLKEVKALAKKETDPYVLLTLFEKGYPLKDAGISDRAMKEKGNTHPEIRAETVKFVLAEKTPETKPYLLEYLSDDDVSVRSEAIRSVSAYDDETLIPYVVEFLHTPENQPYHWYGLAVLEDFARNEPFYDKTSKEAWIAMMDFYHQDVKEGVPSYNDLKILQPADKTNENFIRWCNETPYVNKEEIVQAMYKIIESDVSAWLDAEEAIRIVRIYGTDAQYKALEDMIENRTDPSMKDKLLETYHELLKS